MRNVPLPVLDERTLDHINRVNRRTHARRDALGSIKGNKSLVARIWRFLLDNLDGDGPRSVANLERVFRGRPDLHS
jgi:hypothetical protein